jgi:hypothetical protein
MIWSPIIKSLQQKWQLISEIELTHVIHFIADDPTTAARASALSIAGPFVNVTECNDCWSEEEITRCSH